MPVSIVCCHSKSFDEDCVCERFSGSGRREDEGGLLRELEGGGELGSDESQRHPCPVRLLKLTAVVFVEDRLKFGLISRVFRVIILS